MSNRRRSVEDTRRRILEATMELHAAQGILSTSWEDIAARAGVAVGTVYRHFPSLEELVPACGEASFDRLSLPDPAQIRRLFADLGDRERLRHLVAECYAIYGRAPDAIVAMRRERERHELQDVAEAAARFDAAIDQLVATALRPLRTGKRERALVRALCDFSTWQALVSQGIQADDAIDAGESLVGAVLELTAPLS